MFNLLLDALPTEYEGYLIRTDYRIGIQISQALEDEELEPYERIGIASACSTETGSRRRISHTPGCGGF